MLNVSRKALVRFAVFYALCVYASLVAPEQAAAQGRDSTQLIPVALSLRGVGRVEFDVVISGSRSYVPMVTLFKFLRLNIDYNRSQNTVEGFFLKGDRRYRIDIAGRTASAPDTSF